MKRRGPRHDSLELVAVGHVTVDRAEGGSRLGGAAAYASLAAARLGVSAAVVTSLAPDFPFFDELREVELHYRESLRTTEFENRYLEGERSQRVLGFADSLREKDLAVLSGRLRDDAAVLYGPVVHELDLPLARLAPQGLCGVAPQGFFRDWDEEGRVSKRDWTDGSSALAGADVVVLSESDVDVPEALAESFAGRAFVVTQGRRGCRLYASGDVYDFPAVPARQVDPTGAGDVFAAALLVALREGQTLPRALGFASAAAAIAVEGEGTRTLPSRAEVERRRARVAS